MTARLALAAAVGCLVAVLPGLVASALGPPISAASCASAIVFVLALPVGLARLSDARLPAAATRVFIYLTFIAAGAMLSSEPGGASRRRMGLAVLSFACIASVPLMTALSRLGTFRSVRLLDVIAMNVVVAAIGIEAALQVVATMRPSPLLARSSGWGLIRAYRPPPGTVIHGFPINPRGYYDEEPVAGRPLVLSLADSFGVGTVPHHVHFTTVCERELDSHQVYNMSVAAIGPHEYRLLYEAEGRNLEPSAVVVNIFVGNDIEQSTMAAGMHRGNLMLLNVPRRLMALRRLRIEGGTEGPFFAKSEPLLTPAQARAAYPWLEDPRAESPSMSPRAFLRLETRRARNICTDDSPLEQPFADELSRLVRATRGTKLLVTLIPDELQVEDHLWRAMTASLPGLKLDRTRPQRLIARELRRLGVPCLDFLPILRAVPPMADGKRHLYHRRDTHWNARGNEIAGRALAAKLREILPASRQREPRDYGGVGP